MVLDGPGHDYVASTGGSRNRCSSGVRLHGSGVCEAFAVIPGLGEETCRGQYGQPREARDDVGIRVCEECFLRRRRELGDAEAGGVDLADERDCLVPQSLFDLRQVPQAFGAEDCPKPLDLGFDSTAWTLSALEQRTQLAAGQPGGVGRARCAAAALIFCASTSSAVWSWTGTARSCSSKF